MADAEYLFLEVYVQESKMVLGVVFCPPAIDYFSSLEMVLESLGPEYAPHVIKGDFNTDPTHESNLAKTNSFPFIIVYCWNVM